MSEFEDKLKKIREGTYRDPKHEKDMERIREHNEVQNEYYRKRRELEEQSKTMALQEAKKQLPHLKKLLEQVGAVSLLNQVKNSGVLVEFAEREKKLGRNQRRVEGPYFEDSTEIVSGASRQIKNEGPHSWYLPSLPVAKSGAYLNYYRWNVVYESTGYGYEADQRPGSGPFYRGPFQKKLGIWVSTSWSNTHNGELMVRSSVSNASTFPLIHITPGNVATMRSEVEQFLIKQLR